MASAAYAAFGHAANEIENVPEDGFLSFYISTLSLADINFVAHRSYRSLSSADRIRVPKSKAPTDWQFKPNELRRFSQRCIARFS